MYLCCAEADIELVYQRVRRRLRSLGVRRIVMDVDNDVGDYRAEKMVNNMENSWKVSVFDIFLFVLSSKFLYYFFYFIYLIIYLFLFYFLFIYFFFAKAIFGKFHHLIFDCVLS